MVKGVILVDLTDQGHAQSKTRLIAEASTDEHVAFYGFAFIKKSNRKG